MAILSVFILASIYFNHIRQSTQLRACIERIKPNKDLLTIDIEDLDLCKKVYDNGSSYTHELIKAVVRPQIDGKAGLF